MVAAIANLQSIRTSGRGFPLDINTVLDQWGVSYRDSVRYVDPADRILARYEEPCAASMHFPCDEELERHGVDLKALATVISTGNITGPEVGELFTSLKAGDIDAEQFNDAVCAKLLPKSHNLSAQDAATAAFHMPDILEARMVHDDPIDQALHLKGTEFCPCGVEYHDHEHAVA